MACAQQERCGVVSWGSFPWDKGGRQRKHTSAPACTTEFASPRSRLRRPSRCPRYPEGPRSPHPGAFACSDAPHTPTDEFRLRPHLRSAGTRSSSIMLPKPARARVLLGAACDRGSCLSFFRGGQTQAFATGFCVFGEPATITARTAGSGGAVWRRGACTHGRGSTLSADPSGAQSTISIVIVTYGRTHA